MTTRSHSIKTAWHKAKKPCPLREFARRHPQYAPWLHAKTRAGRREVSRVQNPPRQYGRLSTKPL